MSIAVHLIDIPGRLNILMRTKIRWPLWGIVITVIAMVVLPTQINLKMRAQNRWFRLSLFVAYARILSMRQNVCCAVWSFLCFDYGYLTPNTMKIHRMDGVYIQIQTRVIISPTPSCNVRAQVECTYLCQCTLTRIDEEASLRRVASTFIACVFEIQAHVNWVPFSGIIVHDSTYVYVYVVYSPACSHENMYMHVAVVLMWKTRSVNSIHNIVRRKSRFSLLSNEIECVYTVWVPSSSKQTNKQTNKGGKTITTTTEALKIHTEPVKMYWHFVYGNCCLSHTNTLALCLSVYVSVCVCVSVYCLFTSDFSFLCSMCE